MLTIMMVFGLAATLAALAILAIIELSSFKRGVVLVAGFSMVLILFASGGAREHDRFGRAMPQQYAISAGKLYQVLDLCEGLPFPAVILQELGERKGEVEKPRFVELEARFELPSGKTLVRAVKDGEKLVLEPINAP